MNSGKVRSGRMGGRWLLLLGLMAALGCASPSRIIESSYQVEMPVLEIPPREHRCQVIGPTVEVEQSCTTVLTKDWHQVVRKLKAACLALGGSPVACQTEEPSSNDQP